MYSRALKDFSWRKEKYCHVGKLRTKYFPCFGREKQHKTGKQLASLISWEGQQERYIAALQAPASFHVKVALCRDLLQLWEQETSPSRATLSTCSSAIQRGPRDTMWPSPCCTQAGRGRPGQPPCVVLFCTVAMERPSLWLVKPRSIPALTHLSRALNLELITHAIAQHLQSCLGLVRALCPLENKLPTHASPFMCCW